MAKIAMIVGPGFEDSEFRKPFDQLEAAGHQIEVLGSEPGRVEGKRGDEAVTVEAAAAARDPSDYDALVIPGGRGPENLRTDADVVAFIRNFADTGKPIAAVCHAPQLLIEAGLAAGRTMTSWPSVKHELLDAGARWVDEEVVRDGPFITSRKPDDLDAFVRVLNERL